MKEQELRILTSLTEIYNTTQDENKLSLKSVFDKNNVKYSQCVGKIVRENFVSYRRENKDTYIKWITIKPNVKMVDRIIKEINIYKNENREKYYTDKKK